ncbi:MAG: hypothetical protein JF585_06380 [Burkholderiales bacterium]|nr:hypothetical protein [Burkholderiales bacterium]
MTITACDGSALLVWARSAHSTASLHPAKRTQVPAQQSSRPALSPG